VRNLAITSAARRDMGRLSSDILRRIDKVILALLEQPYPSGCAKLSGTDGLYRVRVGDYRIIYAVNNDESRVTIARVRHRRDVYDNL